MKINKKRLITTIANSLPRHLGISHTQVTAVVEHLFALFAAHRPSRVLELLESEEDKRRNKET